MPYKDIDEIIKNGLYESERRNELQALQAKSRIWNTVVKPKKKPAVHWGFVTALAASLALFLISTLLFLKLESQQKELEDLRAFAIQEIQYPEGFEELASIEPEPEEEEVQPALLERKNKKENAVYIPQKSNLKRIYQEEISFNISKPKPNLEEVVIEVKPEILNIDIFITESKAELNHTNEKNEVAQPVPKTKGKLKFKFGNSSYAYHHQSSTGLTIKL